MIQLTKKINISSDNILIWFLPFLAFLFWFYFSSEEYFLYPDSPGYLSFSPYRTAGYPLFLMIFQKLDISLHAVSLVQLTLYNIAVSFVMYSMRQASMPKFLVVLAFIGLALNPYLTQLHFSILTDSLFVTLILMIIASLILFLNNKDSIYLLSLGIFIGLTIAIRPSAYSLAPFLVLVIVVGCLYQRRINIKYFLAGFLPLLFLIFGEIFIYHSFHQQAVGRNTMLSIHLFGKGAMLQPDKVSFSGPMKKELKKLDIKVDRAMKPVRSLIENAPNKEIANYLQRHYEVFAQYQLLSKERSLLAQSAGVHNEELLTAWGLSRIKNDISGYLSLTFNHYQSLWLIDSKRYPPNAKKLDQYLQQSRPLPYESKPSNYIEHSQPNNIAYLIRFIMIFLFLLTTLSSLFLLKKICCMQLPSYPIILSGLLSLAIHGNFLLTALIGVGMKRYALDMWPMLVIAAISIIWMCDLLIKKKRNER